MPDAKSVVAADGGLLRARALGLDRGRRRRRPGLGDPRGARRRRGGRCARRAAPAGEGRNRSRARARRGRRARREPGAGRRERSRAARPPARLAPAPLGSERYAAIELDALVGDALVHVVRGERRLSGRPRRAAHPRSRSAAPPSGVATEGLEYPLAGETLEPGPTRGISNVFTGTRGPRRARRQASSLRSAPPESGHEDACNSVLQGRRGRRRRGRRSSGSPQAAAEAGTPKEVVLVTHDSFAISKDVKAAFERESGLKLRILQGGDANEMLNRALLTAGDPQGDVIFGIDDSILSRALDADLLEEYRSPELSALQPDFSSPDAHVTPVDHGEVCLNVDRGWFASHRIPPPTGPSPTSSARGTATCSSSRIPRRPRRAWRSCSRPSRRSATAGRRTGAASAQTVSSPSTGGKRRTRSSSPARPAARASGPSSSRTPRAPRPR